LVVDAADSSTMVAKVVAAVAEGAAGEPARVVAPSLLARCATSMAMTRSVAATASTTPFSQRRTTSMLPTQ
jgi:hypothetical protein